MERFLVWFDSEEPVSVILLCRSPLFGLSASTHLKMATESARILSDMQLARGEKSDYRFYNISSQINKDKNHYYDILEKMQHGDGDLTEWLVWYLQSSSMHLMKLKLL